MRLTEFEAQAIKNVYLKVFEGGSIYLFGSRVDDTKKGGDIDLYVVPNQEFSSDVLLKKKLDFLVQVKNLVGDQKIDIVIARDKNRTIEQEALSKGINLMDTQRLKVEKYLNECNKHKSKIIEAFQEIQEIFPLSGKKYKELTDYQIKNIDQFLFRFSKMQDTIGDKLFKFIAKDFVDNVENMTFIDILNTLEKANIIASVQDWKNLREIRNNISHQYDDEEEDMAEALNKIFAQKDILIEIFENIVNFYQNKALSSSES